VSADLSDVIPYAAYYVERNPTSDKSIRLKNNLLVKNYGLKFEISVLNDIILICI
jgi:hypothetical protein